jgi:hypothetical protein
MEVGVVAVREKALSGEQRSCGDELVFVSIQAATHRDAKKRDRDQHEKGARRYVDPVIPEEGRHPKVAEIALRSCTLGQRRVLLKIL